MINCAVTVTGDDLQVQLSTNNTCPTISGPVNPICVSNDTSNISFADRVCDCAPQCKAPQQKNSSVSPAVIGAAAGGAALALIVVVVFVLYCCRRRSRARKIENQVSGYASSIISPKKTSSNSKPGSLSIKGMCFGHGDEDDSTDVALPNSTYTSSSSARYDLSQHPWIDQPFGICKAEKVSKLLNPSGTEDSWFENGQFN